MTDSSPWLVPPRPPTLLAVEHGGVVDACARHSGPHERDMGPRNIFHTAAGIPNHTTQLFGPQEQLCSSWGSK
jgi:hypothetical protein